MSHPLERWPEFVYVRASTAGRKNRQWVVMLKSLKRLPDL